MQCQCNLFRFYVGALFFFLNSLSRLSESPWQNIANCLNWPGPNRDRKTVAMASVDHWQTSEYPPQLRSWHLLSSLKTTLASHKPRPVSQGGGWSLGVKLIIKGDKKRLETSLFAELLVAAGGCWRVFYLFYPGLRSVMNCDNVIHWVQGSVIISDRL